VGNNRRVSKCCQSREARSVNLTIPGIVQGIVPAARVTITEGVRVISKISIRWHILSLLLALCLVNGCAYKEIRLKQDLTHLLESLPEPPSSVLLSETGKNTSGADPLCDGYLVSRLYGTNEPIESIVKFAKDEILPQRRWLLDSRLRREKTSIGLMREDGYLLSIATVKLLKELLIDPFFHHKEVSLDQPYKTIYLLNIVHIDPSQTEHCWDF